MPFFFEKMEEYMLFQIDIKTHPSNLITGHYLLGRSKLFIRKIKVDMHVILRHEPFPTH